MSSGAITSQFSLGFEITQVAPIQASLDVATTGLLALTRKFQNAGSDLYTEHVFAETIGKALLDPQFASTFRTAIRISRVHKLAGIVELVLEAGAAQSVKHALAHEHRGFFSMMAQLSLLSWALEIKTLAACLESALSHSFLKNPEDSPTIDTILGVLRCIREQTCGFMWELHFESIESIIEEAVGHKGSRVLSFNVLSNLFQILHKVRRTPEKYILDLRTTDGVSTIVLWANKLLGINVAVKSGDRIWLSNPNEEPSIYIDCAARDDKTYNNVAKPEVTLMSESKDILLSSRGDMPPELYLRATFRHPILGLGDRIWEMYRKNDHPWLDHKEQRLHVIKFVGKRALWESNNDAILMRQVYGVNIVSRIALALSILFRGLSPNLSVLESVITEQVGGSPRQQPDTRKEISAAETLVGEKATYDREDKTYPASMETKIDLSSSAVEDSITRWIGVTIPRSLVSIVRTLSLVTDLKMAQDAFLCFEYSLISMLSSEPGIRGIHKNLYSLLTGEAAPEPEGVAIASSWGWSMCLSSVHSKDPEQLYNTIDLVKGVPSRNGERRALVIDSSIHPGTLMLSETGYDIVASPGDEISLNCPLYAQPADNLIGRSEDAFTVSRRFTVVWPNIERVQRTSLGNYLIQRYFWESLILDSCQCEKIPRHGDKIRLPSYTWAFDGLPAAIGTPFPDPWELESNPPAGPSRKWRGIMTKMASQEDASEWIREPTTSTTTRDTETRVHLSRSAGNKSMRWMLLSETESLKRSHSRRIFNATSVLHHRCCVECALKQIKSRTRGTNFEDTHMVLIT